MTNGVKKITGNSHFIIGTTDFMISPLTADAELHIIKLGDITSDKKVADIAAGEYTKVHGAIPNTEFYINTSDVFEIKW